MASPSDEIKQSLDNLKRAADAVADKILGTDVTGQLRDAARLGLRAAKAALDHAEQELDKRKAGHAGHSAHSAHAAHAPEVSKPVDAPAPFTTPTTPAP